MRGAAPRRGGRRRDGGHAPRPGRRDARPARCRRRAAGAAEMTNSTLAARAKRLRGRAGEFERLARDAGDPVVYQELLRLALLYRAQAEMAERGDEPPADLAVRQD